MHFLEPITNLFNKLKYKNKLALMFISVITPFLVFSYFTYKSFYKELETIHSEQKALQLSSKILTLIKELQVHRGLMQGFLNGQKSFKKDIVKEEKEIDKIFLELNSFKNIIDVKKLKDEYLKIKSIKDIDKNFLLHTKLIEYLLKLNKDIAIFYGLFKENNVKDYYIITSIFDILPNISENIGKIRGYLTGYLTKKEIKKEKIQNLLTTLTFEIEKLDSAIKTAFNDKDKEYADLKKSLKAYMNSVKRTIDQKENITPREFFDYSTKIISKVNSFHKEISKRFEKYLQTKEKRLYFDILLLTSGLLLVIFTSLYLFLGFYLSVTNSLQKIMEATKRMTEQDYSKDLVIYTKDEFTNIADTLNRMQKEIKKHINFLKWYQIALDSATLVTKSDIKGNITYANRAFLKKSGYKLEEILGKPYNIFRHPEMPKEIFKNMWDTILSKKVWKGILKIRTKDGKDLIMKISIVPILDEKEDIKEFVAVIIDITDLIKTQEKIKRMLHFDNLTSLPNRTKLMEDLKNYKAFAIAVFNINNFREINDIYGFEAGNFILKKSVEILKKFEDKDIKLYRLPADEFAFIFFSKRDKKEIQNFALKVTNAIENHIFTYNEFDISILLRCGISIFNEEYESIEKTLLDAEAAVKEVKTTSYKCLFFEESETAQEEYKKTLLWIKKIKDAIVNDRIVPYFQPLYNKTQKIEKYEALVRLIDEDGKVVSPFFFLDIAKKAKLYTKITQIMVEKSLKTFENRDEEISINISMQDLLDKNTVEFIKEKLKEYHMKKRVIFENRENSFNSVVIEITESEEIENYDLVIDFIKDIKQYNVKISIDDFGTGYSNFVYILNMGVDYLKIDGSLIKNILKDDKSLTLVKAIDSFTKELSIKTVAEFVSDEYIQKKIEEIGIDYSQGYYISKPIPADKLPKSSSI